MTEEAQSAIAQPATEAKGLSLKVVALPSPSLAFSNVVLVSEATLKQLNTAYVQLDQRAIFLVGSNAFVEDGEIALNAFQRESFAQHLNRQAQCMPFDCTGAGVAFIDTAQVKLQLLSPLQPCLVNPKALVPVFLQRYKGHIFEQGQSMAIEYLGMTWKVTFADLHLRSGHGPDPRPVQGDHGLLTPDVSKLMVYVVLHKCVTVEADQTETR